ncbi:MAG: lysophospholipid acyltransferase family protein [Planctomycetota bacterium]
MDEPEVVRRYSPFLFKWFARVSLRMVRKRFEAVRVLKGCHPAEAGWPEGPYRGGGVVVMNHPGWWDPMAAVVAAKKWMPGALHFAPMDAAMLKSYPLMDRMGFFGIEQGTARGGAAFMKTAVGLLRGGEAAQNPSASAGFGGGSSRVLWVTGPGVFRDVRERPVGLMPGVARLAGRLARSHPAEAGWPDGVVGGEWVMVMAVEYVFWDQSRPEMLMAFGAPVPVGEVTAEGLEGEMERVMDALAAAAVKRDPGLFEVVEMPWLTRKRVGVGGAYDQFRRLWSWCRGRRFDPRHGAD